VKVENMTAKIRSFRELDVWQRAMDLAVECYGATRTFPDPERFGLTAQIRRSAVSIPSNLAEGHNRGSRLAFRNHVGIALGSQAELETQIALARRLAYLRDAAAIDLQARIEQVGQLLHGLARALDRAVDH
jgi:four helix bundle protein